MGRPRSLRRHRRSVQRRSQRPQLAETFVHATKACANAGEESEMDAGGAINPDPASAELGGKAANSTLITSTRCCAPPPHTQKLPQSAFKERVEKSKRDP